MNCLYLVLLAFISVMIQYVKPSDRSCMDRSDPGRGNQSIRSYFFRQAWGDCYLMGYRGQAGNRNRFGSREECRRTCFNSTSVCVQPSDLGALHYHNNLYHRMKYFYNATSQRCERFMYGGEAGNGNRFQTYDECYHKCEVLVVNACLSDKKEEGNCTASANESRYFFNTANGKCEHFIYTGCGGNENRFETKEECELTCSGFNRILELLK